MVDASVKSFFDNTISLDFLHLFTGNVLGAGVYRTVYECSVRPDLVVKIEIGSRHFQNITEYEVWDEWSGSPKVAKWLAPCEAISACGTILLQKRTSPVPEGKFPAKLPTFLTDTKRANYGMLGKRFVCHDYGSIRSTLKVNMVKADWW